MTAFGVPCCCIAGTRFTEYTPLVNAQVMLTGTRRDRVVTSYTLLAAVGRLEPEVLHLPITVADAK